MSHRFRVAVADDDSSVREYLALCLAELGHEVTAVDGGRSLIELCRAAGPNLVISDVRMPDGDGLTAADVIRQESSVPIILISGGWTCEQRERAAAIGTTCLEKPLRPLGLMAAIAAATRADGACRARSADGRADPGDDASRQTDLKEQVDALQARVASLQELDEKRAAFLATLVHELRNPLCPLLNYAKILTMKATTPDVRAVVEKIDRQVRQLGRLVEDLMDVARVCQGKARLDLRRVDAREIVGQAVDAVKPQIEAARHRLAVAQPGDPVWLVADPDRLGQVVVNLLTNAGKSTPPGGRIAVAVEAVDGQVTLRVKDTGVGIPADRIGSVFDLFSQDDRSMPRAQGGLGLALVKELVALHGGTVHARSDGGDRGSEFVVRLPAAAG